MGNVKIIKRIIRNILSKFNLPKMDISDKEYEEYIKEYVNKVGTEKGEPLIVPNENFKRIMSKLNKQKGL